MIRVDIDKNVTLVKASHGLAVVDDESVDKLLMYMDHPYNLYGRLQRSRL